MSIDGRTADQALDEVADAQASLDPTRSECVRPTILDHFHRWMRAKSLLDKYMELDGLIRACLPHIQSDRTRKDVLEALDDPSLRGDILTQNADKFFAGVPFGILEANEAYHRYPILASIFDIVQRDLVASGLLPWALSYPEKALDSYIYGQLMQRVEEKRNESDRIREVEHSRNAFAGAVPVPLLASVQNRDPERTAPHPEPTEPELPPRIENTRATSTETDVEEGAIRPRSVPFGPRLADMDHAAYMKTRMAAFRGEVEHIGDWRPDELPVPPAEIDEAAETVKQALKKIPKKGT